MKSLYIRPKFDRTELQVRNTVASHVAVVWDQTALEVMFRVCGMFDVIMF